MKDLDSRSEGSRPATNPDIARVFSTIADLLEFKDENFFKIRSYRAAAETIEEMRDSLRQMAGSGGATELQKLPGIGKTISNQIIEIIQTGTTSALEELKEDVPITVLDLKLVSGIGLKTAQLLYREFGISNLDDLKAFAEGDGLLSVPGLGEKVISRIKTSLAQVTGGT